MSVLTSSRTHAAFIRILGGRYGCAADRGRTLSLQKSFRIDMRKIPYMDYSLTIYRKSHILCVIIGFVCVFLVRRNLTSIAKTGNVYKSEC